MANASQVQEKTLPHPPRQIAIEDEMANSYIAYAMSVIVSRALPDVRDGLKPVHRRILYAMFEGGYTSTKPYNKSAKMVGDTMGDYHPHGDSSIYEALVRMAQPHSMRVLLIDGQGNYGSIDGDPPAAMRYTESRLSSIVDNAMVQDLRIDSVDFHPTYDNKNLEPQVLPSRFPNILVNGGEGIAVGMATKIPTHNLEETINVTLEMIQNPLLDVEGVMKIMPGPDFPTAGVIQGRGAIKQAYETGRASMTVSGVWHVESKGNRQSVVITQLPYAVNKKSLLEKIIELVRAKGNAKETKFLEGISDVRDESDRDGIRVVIEIRKDSEPELVINQLKKHTNLVTTFPMNMVCLNSVGQPQTMGVLQVFKEFIAFRRDVIARRTRFLLEKTRQGLNIKIARYAARTRLEEVIGLIRNSSTRDDARAKLMALRFPTEGELASLLTDIDPDVDVPEMFKLSFEQANDIMRLELQQLTAIDIDETVQDVRSKIAEIRGYLNVLNNPTVMDDIMVRELVEVREQFKEPRKTQIESAGPSDISDDDLIDQKQVVLTLTRAGYVKITPLDAYREQARGGKGKSGMETKDDDVVSKNMICNTRDTLIFFTSRGIAHTLKAYKLPMVAPNAKGRPIVNFIETLRQGETIAAIMPQPSTSRKIAVTQDDLENEWSDLNTEDENMVQKDESEITEQNSSDKFMIFITDTGNVRLNNAADFENVNKSGKIAMKLEDSKGQPVARLIDVLNCQAGDDLVLATQSGKVARFGILEEVRPMSSRSSIGVTGIKLAKNDRVIGASIIKHFDATFQERDAYFSEGSTTWKDENATEHSLTLSTERMQEMASSEQFLLTVTAQGYGKRFSSHDFRTTARGAQGVWGGSFSSTTGNLIACFPVVDSDGLVLITDEGQSIRIGIGNIRVMGRSTRGVRLFNLAEGQTIVDVAKISSDPTIDQTEN